MNPSPKHGVPERILLVEDSPTQGARLKFDLEGENFLVQWVRDGGEALAAIDSFAPHAVVTDVLMPGLDGFELCREIRARESCRELPIIVVTALSEPDDIIRALEVGATHFLVKPFPLDLLVSLLRQIALNRRLEKAPAADFAIQINFKGKVHHIRSDRFQILDLLFSTYENMVEKTRALDRTNRLLLRATDELHAAVAQKDALLREIHHRVRNNFQLLSGLLGLETARCPDPRAAAALCNAKERLNAMAAVHDKLYGIGNLAEIDFTSYLHDLATSLLESHSQDSARFSLREELAPLRLDVEAAIPCALIASELVGNALKHGLAGRDSGELFVGLAVGGGAVTLTVGDDGQGLPPGFQLDSGEFLGLMLVKLFARQLGGSLQVISPAEGGCWFSVAFPAGKPAGKGETSPAPAPETPTGALPEPCGG